MNEPSAVLRIGSDETELPMVVGTEGERGIDISKLRAQTGAVTLDNGFVNTGVVRVVDHLHRRRSGHPPLPRHPHRGAGVGPGPLVPRDLVPAHLRRAAHPHAARRVPLRHPQAHAAARRRQALLRRLPQGRPPDGHAVVGGERAVDLLPGQQRPPRPRAGAPLDPAADGQAADDRRVRVQEVDRPAVPLPRQLARPHRELPHDDVRGAVGALRGRATTPWSPSSSC